MKHAAFQLPVVTLLERKSIKNLDWDLLWEQFGIAAMLALFWIFATILTPRFASQDNLVSACAKAHLSVLRLSA